MGKKILIVDDDPFACQVLQPNLEGAGYEVLLMTNGSEGLRKARLEKPDLVILDVPLPQLHGYRLCRLLKFDENYKHIPVLILSRQTTEEDKEKALQAGADLFLSKSVELGTLMNKISGLLNR